MEGWWWVSFCVRVYVCACAGEWMRMCVSEWVRVSEWGREGVSEWEWAREGVRVSECDGVSGVREWETDWLSEWMSDRECVGEWVGVSKWGRVSGPSAIDQHHDLSRQVRIKQPVYLAYIRPIADQVPRLPRCRAPSAVLATQKLPAERRRPRDARASSDPLQSTKCRACHTKSSGDQGTPGRKSDSFAEHQVPRLPRKK